MLDYRCHVDKLPGVTKGARRLGKSYPSQVHRCLTKLASMTDTEVMAEYGEALCPLVQSWLCGYSRKTYISSLIWVALRHNMILAKFSPELFCRFLGLCFRT